MSWYALGAIDDALTATRRFLMPFELGTWFRLAIVAFFLGGAGTPLNAVNYTVEGPGQFPGGPPDVPLPSEQLLAVVLALAALAAVLGLAFAVVSAVMEFVLVDAVVAREIHVRRYVRDRLDEGLRLFGFQVAVGLLVAGLLAALFVPTVLTGVVPPLFLLLAIPAFLVLALFVGLLFQLTTDFVVPVMLARDAGVLDGWRAFWPTLRTNLAQVALYVVVRWVLGLGVAIVVGFVTGLLGLAFLFVVGLPVGLAFFATGGFGPLALILLVVVGIPVLLAFLLAVAFVQVPVQTYFRYYALLVLADLEPEFDLLGEFGRAVREESAGA